MKYYAVRNGRKPGIYTTWAECEAQTKGFSNAQFKSFSTEEEAQAFIDGNVASPKSEEKKDTETENLPKGPYAFVDGSYNPKTKVYGCGGFLNVDGMNYPIQDSGNSEDMALMRNVAGETIGAMAAVRLALELGLTELTILYDYIGIEMWATDRWNTNKPGTIAYKAFMQDAMKKLRIVFVKVKAHTGIPGNELADQLAKQAVGIKTDADFSGLDGGGS